MKPLLATIFAVEIRRACWVTLVFLAELLSLTGCVVGPKYHPPSAPSPPTYKEMGNWKTTQPIDQNLGGNWWEMFQDPQLNLLEQQVNVSNQNLKAAVAQFQEARAALRYAGADYYPTITASPSATREKYSSNSPLTPSSRSKTVDDFTIPFIPFTLSYQTNAWRRVSRNVELYREQAQASAADLAVVNLTLRADLAVDYFAVRTLDAEAKLLRDTVAQYEQALQLNEDAAMPDPGAGPSFSAELLEQLKEHLPEALFACLRGTVATTEKQLDTTRGELQYARQKIQVLEEYLRRGGLPSTGRVARR